jgi:PAS domain S-box-containing protein
MTFLAEKEQLATFARNANLSVCTIDENLRLTWGSSAFNDLFKVEEHQYLGMAFSHLLFQSERPCDEFFMLFHEAFSQPISGGVLRNVRSFPRASHLDLKVFKLANEGGFMVTLTHQLDQSGLERELNLIRGQLDELVQHTAIPVCYTNFEGKFMRVNLAFCELFGRTETELLGHDFMEFHFGSCTADEQLELRREVYYKLSETDFIRKTFELNDKEGRLQIFDMVLRSVQVDGLPAISAQLIQKQTTLVSTDAVQQEVKSLARETAAQLRKPLANLQGLLEMIKSGTENRQTIQFDASALVMLSNQLSEAVQNMNEVVYGLDDLRQMGVNEAKRKVDSVWIVDDDQVITYITEHMLRNADNALHITSFLSAKMALEKLRLDGVAPDVLLLDINMPGITGWEFLDQLSATGLEANVYMYSSSIYPDDVKEARNYPMVKEFISKPLDVRTIRQILSVRNEEQRKVS